MDAAFPPGTPATCDPSLCVRTVFTLLRPRAEGAGIDLRFHGGGVDRVVPCAAGDLRGALLPLCRLALDSLGKGPGAVTVRMTEPARGRLRIEVDGGMRFVLEVPAGHP